VGGDVLDQPLRALDVEDDLGARHARQHVAGEEREQLIAEDDAPRPVHRADAVGVAVEADAEIGAVAREAGIPYLLDACQSVGQLPVDVDEIGCDLLSATGRKYLRGPRGTGLLYVRSSLLDRLEPPFLDLRAADWVEPDRYELRPDARRFEEWEQGYATKAGLATAIDYALGWSVAATWERVAALGESLRARLGDVEGVTVRDLGAVRCGIVTFTVDGIGAEQLKRRLARERINVTVSPPSSTLLDARERQLPELVRASVHYYNTDEELERLVESVIHAAPR